MPLDRQPILQSISATLPWTSQATQLEAARHMCATFGPDFWTIAVAPIKQEPAKGKENGRTSNVDRTKCV